MVEDFSFGLRWEIYMKPASKFKGMATPRRERQRSMIYRSRWRCGRRGTKVRKKVVLILDGDVRYQRSCWKVQTIRSPMQCTY
jgi:hypothetical protein